MKEISEIASQLRNEYAKRTLSEEDVSPNPSVQFGEWFKEAIESEILNANAMSLATATPDGHPSIRIVLLKGIDHGGFVFYTNYHSRKGIEISRNKYGALNFFWKELERQVRIEGVIEKTSSRESDEYFSTRPRGSQLSAVASPQSVPVKQGEMQKAMSELDTEFQNKEIDRPAHWGGYRLKPNKIEFWQGRPNRLHDRILYTLKDGDWIISRLAP